MGSAAETSTGYGPSAGYLKRILFDGNADNFELWLSRFLAHLRLRKLGSIITQDGVTAEGNAEKNADVFAELVQVLDDKSLSLIIRDSPDDGNKALQILREHYLGSTKPRIISLYSELTTLKMETTETVTDYLLRGETAATRLRSVKEAVSDSLLIAMILKGLPDSFKAFCTVITQRDEVDFQQFKVAIKSYEENEKARANKDTKEEVVMNVVNRKIICFGCGKAGHKKSSCNSKIVNMGPAENSNNSVFPGKHHVANKSAAMRKSRWCKHCRSNTHDTNYCRKLNSVKSCDETMSSNEYFFSVSASSGDGDGKTLTVDNDNCLNFLVDCGATAHILNDYSRFVNFDSNFEREKHLIELADGSKNKNFVEAKGDASVTLVDSSGRNRNVTLKDALYITTFKQNILSVQSIASKGSKVTFSKEFDTLETPDGNCFNIVKSGKLYYLNSLSVSHIKTRTLMDWHLVMGHCNFRDILKLENCVEGMKITDKSFTACSTCDKGKMCQFRNRDPDERATCPLELVHSDLAGPIHPVSHNGSKYVMSFVDDFSGIIFLYFLKNKSDSVDAAAKFLADIAPFGSVKCIRSDQGTEYTSHAFQKLMIENKIRHDFSAPHSPHQNGTAKRSWRTLFDMARCLLIEKDLPKELCCTSIFVHS